MAKKDDYNDPTKAPEGANLYKDGVSGGDRLKSTFDSSQILGADGKFLGMPISGAMAGTVRTLWDQALPELASYVGDHSTQVVQNFAKNYLAKDPKAALEFGKKYGGALTYGVVLMQPIAETASAAYSTGNRLSELRGALMPVLKANGQSTAGAGIFSDSNNEVIHNARQKIFVAAKNDVVGTMARSVALIPSIRVAMQKESQKLNANMSKMELAYIKEHGTPEQMSEYLQRNLKSKLNTTHESRKIVNEQKLEQKKIYEEGFEKSIGDYEYKFEEALEKAMDSKKSLSKDFKQELGYGKNSNPSEEDLRDRWVKYAYADDHGAWNDEWLRPSKKSGKDRKNNKTHVDMIDEVFQGEIDKMNGVSEEKGKGAGINTEKTVNQMTQLFFSLGGETLRGFVTKDANKNLKQELALDMILDMRRQLDENPERTSISGGKGNKEDFSFSLYVHKIFQQNQHDSGLSEIGDRYTKSMRATNWSDEQIQKMKDSDLNPYEASIKHISQYIRDGRMDPLALINLVGERKIVQKSGKAFGTLKTNDNVELTKSVVDEIDHQSALMRPHHKMEDEEVSAALGNYTFTEEELQAAFSAHGLEGEAKAFMFALLDANTPDDAVLKNLTGRSGDEIKQLRMDGQKHFSNQLDAALREIADDLKENPAAMGKYDLTEEEASRFQEVYKKAKDTGGSIGDVLSGESRKAVASSVANILVDDSLHHGGRFWRDKVKPHAEKTEVENHEEAKAKEVEKKEIEADGWADDVDKKSDFKDRVANGKMSAANSNYEDSMPYVSKAQSSHSGAHKRSHASKAKGSGAEMSLAT